MLQASYSQGLSVPPQRLGSTHCVELEHAYTTNHCIKCDDVNATEQAGAGPGPCSTLRQPAGRGRMSGLTVTTGGRKKKPVRWQQMQLQHLQQKVC